MNYIICIDDTDNLESKGTGSIAEELKKILEDEFGAKTSFVSRHQLLLHQNIAYTSHNSSMAFQCEFDERKELAAKDRLCSYLQQEAAVGSDPGIAILNTSRSACFDQLIAYGKDAKTRVLTKAETEQTAAACQVFLKALGGTGDGIIGALAGVGLRFSGNDGEMKGAVEGFEKGEIYQVKTLFSHPDIDGVKEYSGIDLQDTDAVLISWRVKLSLENDRRTLIVRSNHGQYETMHKEDLRRYDTAKNNVTYCDRYQSDVEEELCEGNQTSCLNCRFRIWEELNFRCAKESKTETLGYK
nr:hypothetical protein [uncultured Acetobacterium sp.]